MTGPSGDTGMLARILEDMGALSKWIALVLSLYSNPIYFLNGLPLKREEAVLESFGPICKLLAANFNCRNKLFGNVNGVVRGGKPGPELRFSI